MQQDTHIYDHKERVKKRRNVFKDRSSHKTMPQRYLIVSQCDAMSSYWIRQGRHTDYTYEREKTKQRKKNRRKQINERNGGKVSCPPLVGYVATITFILISIYRNELLTLLGLESPFRGQFTEISSRLSPKRDCGSKRVK